MNISEFEKKLADDAESFEIYFEKLFACDDVDIKRVTDAMKYSAMSGGKRIRPFITLEFCRMFKGDVKVALPLAAALECVHTYSLIHDDLPCMDNDDLRRGKPTCHKAYGEEFALLAGDALLTYAFEIVSDACELDEKKRLDAIRSISKLAGINGMVGGQTIDLESEGSEIKLEKLLKLHSLKTGALIRCAAHLGAIAANANDEQIRAADEYASALGLAFQITDDILDVVADEKELGKKVGSDAQNKKVTFLSFMDIDAAREYAKKTTDAAKRSIDAFDGRDVLDALADYVVERRK